MWPAYKRRNELILLAFYPRASPYCVRESRAFYNGSLCVRFKNVPHDTQGWCIHLCTEQRDSGPTDGGPWTVGEGLGEWEEGNRGNTHEHCIHSRGQVGEFGPRVAPTKTEIARSSSTRDRDRRKKRERGNSIEGGTSISVAAVPRKEKVENKKCIFFYVHYIYIHLYLKKFSLCFSNVSERKLIVFI